MQAKDFDWDFDWLWNWIFGGHTSTPPGTPIGFSGGGGSLYALIGSMYFDPITGKWRFPDFSITVTTTAPRSSGSTWTPPLSPPPLTPPPIGPWEPRPPGQDLLGGGGGPSTPGGGETNIPEKPEPRPEVGIIDWEWDPETGQWIPVFAEKPEPDPKAGIIDWRWDPETGQWIPVYSATGVTSPPGESRTTTATTSPPPGGWIYDPFRDVYIPLPGITFVVDVTTTRPDVEYHTAPISTDLTTSVTTPSTTTTSGEGPVAWIYDPIQNILRPIFTVTATTTTPGVEYHTSPITTTMNEPGRTTQQDTTTTNTTVTNTTTTNTTTTDTTTTDTTTTETTTTTVGGGPGVIGKVSGAGAPVPGPPAPIVGSPLGQSVWQLSQYIPALVPHLGYFLAGR
jgi:hypothetical protein